MATISKTSTTKNEVRYRVRVVTSYAPDGTPKQTMRTFNTKREAENWAKAEELRVAQGLVADPGRIALRAYLDEWLDRSAKRIRPSSLAGYRALLARYVFPHIGGLLLRDANPATMQRVIDKLPTAYTAGQSRRILHIAFEEAARLGLLAHNPIDRVTAPAHQPRQGQAWTAAEARSFLTIAAADMYQPYWVLALGTGMRPSEVLGLQWGDLDLERGTLAVCRARATVSSTAYDGAPKSRAGTRALDLPPALVALLRAHRIAQLERRLALGELWADHDLVCASEVGTPIDLHNVANRFRRLCAQAGVPKIRPYDLRHTAISLMAEQGHDLKAISELVGHSDPRLTARVYQHGYPHQRKAALDGLGTLLGGSPEPPGEALSRTN